VFLNFNKISLCNWKKIFSYISKIRSNRNILIADSCSASIYSRKSSSTESCKIIISCKLIDKNNWNKGSALNANKTVQGWTMLCKNVMQSIREIIIYFRLFRFAQLRCIVSQEQIGWNLSRPSRNDREEKKDSSGSRWIAKLFSKGWRNRVGSNTSRCRDSRQALTAMTYALEYLTLLMTPSLNRCRNSIRNYWGKDKDVQYKLNDVCNVVHEYHNYSFQLVLNDSSNLREKSPVNTVYFWWFFLSHLSIFLQFQTKFLNQIWRLFLSSE